MFDLSRLEQAVVADDPNEKLFVKFCREYGIEPELLHKLITRKSDNIQFEVAGLSKRGRAAWIMIREYDENYQGPRRPALLVDIRKFHKFYTIN